MAPARNPGARTSKPSKTHWPYSWRQAIHTGGLQGPGILPQVRSASLTSRAIEKLVAEPAYIGQRECAIERKKFKFWRDSGTPISRSYGRWNPLFRSQRTREAWTLEAISLARVLDPCPTIWLLCMNLGREALGFRWSWSWYGKDRLLGSRREGGRG